MSYRQRQNFGSFPKIPSLDTAHDQRNDVQRRNSQQMNVTFGRIYYSISLRSVFLRMIKMMRILSQFGSCYYLLLHLICSPSKVQSVARGKRDSSSRRAKIPNGFPKQSSRMGRLSEKRMISMSIPSAIYSYNGRTSLVLKF